MSVRGALEFIASLVENFSILYFMSYYLGFKDKYSSKAKNLILIMFTVMLCGMSVLGSNIASGELIFMSLAILLCICYALIFLKGTFINDVFISLIPFVLIAVINSVSLYIFSTVTSSSMTHLINEKDGTRVLLLVVTKGSFILAMSLIARLSPKSDFIFKKNEVLAIIAIFISSYFISMFILDKQMSVDYVENNSNNIYFMFAVLGLLVINVFTYLSYLKIEKDNREKIQYELVKLQLEQQKQSYEEFEKKHFEIRKIRHDMRNYMEACLALMQSGDYESAQEYLDDICNNVIKPINYTIVTNSSLINALLNNELHLCNNYNIKVDYKILSDFDGFKELDICVLLGNLWNNAIEATKDLDGERKINFEVLQKKNYLVIILRNTIRESILKKNSEFKTTKTDKYNHGFGVISMKDVVERYDGVMDITEKGNKIEFQILLKRGLKAK
ncbi:GHKL domain-containing protein [Anaerosporobacter sp.]|uniref:GHKL domain-containing protein n=1 Tax=Anaerosporobacter sp. TaxID=1872529 RepID=UPI00286F6421|nr:GHKL domain-containing protein [Anaerosporobacter sp.]